MLNVCHHMTVELPLGRNGLFISTERVNILFIMDTGHEIHSMRYIL